MVGQALRALSHAQQRIMYGETFHKGANFANLAVAYCLSADLNIDRLEQGINAVLKSKDAFRLQLKLDEESDLNVQYVREYSDQHVFVSICKLKLQRL